MNSLFLTAVLLLVPVSADDDRLTLERTFVSPSAQIELSSGDGQVLCLEQPRREKYAHICLTRNEWQQAIALAEEGKGEETQAERRDRLISRAHWYARSF